MRGGEGFGRCDCGVVEATPLSPLARSAEEEEVAPTLKPGEEAERLRPALPGGGPGLRNVARAAGGLGAGDAAGDGDDETSATGVPVPEPEPEPELPMPPLRTSAGVETGRVSATGVMAWPGSVHTLPPASLAKAAGRPLVVDTRSARNAAGRAAEDRTDDVTDHDGDTAAPSAPPRPP
jgi:hypothetical protein